MEKADYEKAKKAHHTEVSGYFGNDVKAREPVEDTFKPRPFQNSGIDDVVSLLSDLGFEVGEVRSSVSHRNDKDKMYLKIEASKPICSLPLPAYIGNDVKPRAKTVKLLTREKILKQIENYPMTHQEAELRGVGIGRGRQKDKLERFLGRMAHHGYSTSTINTADVLLCLVAKESLARRTYLAYEQTLGTLQHIVLSKTPSVQSDRELVQTLALMLSCYMSQDTL